MSRACISYQLGLVDVVELKLESRRYPENRCKQIHKVTFSKKAAIIFIAGYRGGTIFGGYQIFLPCFIGLPIILPLHDGVSNLESTPIINIIYMLSTECLVCFSEKNSKMFTFSKINACKQKVVGSISECSMFC